MSIDTSNQFFIMKETYFAHIEYANNIIYPIIAVELTSTIEGSVPRLYIAWFDTGATNTLLSKRVFDSNKFVEVGTTPAAGPIKGQEAEELKKCRALFRITGTDNSEFKDTVDVAVSNKDFNGYDMLLGLDILSNAIFCYDGFNKVRQISFKKTEH